MKTKYSVVGANLNEMTPVNTIEFINELKTNVLENLSGTGLTLSDISVSIDGSTNVIIEVKSTDISETTLETIIESTPETNISYKIIELIGNKLDSLNQVSVSSSTHVKGTQPEPEPEPEPTLVTSMIIGITGTNPSTLTPTQQLILINTIKSDVLDTLILSDNTIVASDITVNIDSSTGSIVVEISSDANNQTQTQNILTNISDNIESDIKTKVAVISNVNSGAITTTTTSVAQKTPATRTRIRTRTRTRTGDCLRIYTRLLCKCGFPNYWLKPRH